METRRDWERKRDGGDEQLINYLVEYHRKSLVSFVVLTCSNRTGSINELLPQMPTFSLYQLHTVGSSDISLTEVDWANEASPRLLCETIFNMKNDGTNEFNKAITVQDISST